MQAGKDPGVLLPLVVVLVGVCMCVLSFLAAGRSCLPVLDPLSLVVGWGQVSLQSADAQEQVEGLLTENNALRTSLAALEQVQDTWEPMLIPPLVPLSPSACDPHWGRVAWTSCCSPASASISFSASFSLFHICWLEEAYSLSSST